MKFSAILKWGCQILLNIVIGERKAFLLVKTNPPTLSPTLEMSAPLQIQSKQRNKQGDLRQITNILNSARYYLVLLLIKKGRLEVSCHSSIRTGNLQSRTSICAWFSTGNFPTNLRSSLLFSTLVLVADSCSYRGLSIIK